MGDLELQSFVPKLPSFEEGLGISFPEIPNVDDVTSIASDTFSEVTETGKGLISDGLGAAKSFYNSDISNWLHQIAKQIGAEDLLNSIESTIGGIVNSIQAYVNPVANLAEPATQAIQEGLKIVIVVNPERRECHKGTEVPVVPPVNLNPVAQNTTTSTPTLNLAAKVESTSPVVETVAKTNIESGAKMLIDLGTSVVTKAAEIVISQVVEKAGSLAGSVISGLTNISSISSSSNTSSASSSTFRSVNLNADSVLNFLVGALAVAAPVAVVAVPTVINVPHAAIPLSLATLTNVVETPNITRQVASPVSGSRNSSSLISSVAHNADRTVTVNHENGNDSNATVTPLSENEIDSPDTQVAQINFNTVDITSAQATVPSASAQAQSAARAKEDLLKDEDERLAALDLDNNINGVPGGIQAQADSHDRNEHQSDDDFEENDEIDDDIAEVATLEIPSQNRAIDLVVV